MLVLETPTRLRVPELSDSDRLRLQKVLTYTNKAKQYELARLKKNPWFVNQHGEERYREELDRVKSEIQVSLLKEDAKGLWTYPGLAKTVQDCLGLPLTSNVAYNEARGLPWAKIPSGEDRYYQKQMLENMVQARHASVEVGTGLGKSRVIRNLCRYYGLKTVVMAPSRSIARQLYNDLSYHLGGKYVGLYGDGSKKSNKLITVGLFQSLGNIEPGSQAWNDLSQTEVFICDESHLTPAVTLTNVCENLCGDAPYRFFFSGTQMRNDGADLLLEGIIGPVVYNMDVRRGVDEGFLSKPNFYVVEMDSPSVYMSQNPDAMLDKHFYQNPAMYAKAADIANKAVSLLGHQVLILIKEVTQFQYLYPHLRHVTGFAHGGVTKTNKASVPTQYHDSDPEALVEELNAGRLPILVGTSCISIGTDIRTPKTLINLQGGTSEVQIRQAIGRGTRKTESKSEFNYFDFSIRVRARDPNFEAISERHASIRYNIYRDVYDNVKVI
jgi:superfamily II DNA or RNA helicase